MDWVIIAEHLHFCGDLTSLMSSIPHRQRVMWTHRINELNKDPGEKASTPQSSEAAWTTIIATNTGVIKD
jgi:hypothetical protein